MMAPFSTVMPKIFMGDLKGENFRTRPNGPLFMPVFSTALLREWLKGGFQQTRDREKSETFEQYPGRSHGVKKTAGLPRQSHGKSPHG